MAGIDAERPFVPIRIAILTMSDSRSLAEDTSGSYLERAITEAGRGLSDRKLVKDDVGQIQSVV